ncbi:MAG: aminotransferase class V-fold PLP-dependent enzyme, partial [Chloroflexi bacterium]
MDFAQFAQTRLSRLPPRLAARLERYLNKIPSFQSKIEAEYKSMLDELEGTVKPYKEGSLTFVSLPDISPDRLDILVEMERLQELERPRWENGFVSGAVYHGEQEHIRFLNQIYALHSQTNPLHADVWPSIAKYEAEIVSMTARMLGAEPGSAVRGTVTSGGTESIMLAIKTYRDWARETKGIKHPELIVPVTAHAAFEKAAQYFNIRLVQVPIDSSFRADISAVRKALSRNTIAIAGSAPSFPHGVMDPLEGLSELARERKVGFHVDACLGGFVLPWAEKLGYAVPPFDFRLPGVTSMSADTHKYGYAPKGSSVVLYKTSELRRYQY